VLKAANGPSATNIGQAWKAPLTRKQQNTPTPAQRRLASGQKTNVRSHDAIHFTPETCDQEHAFPHPEKRHALTRRRNWPPQWRSLGHGGLGVPEQRLELRRRTMPDRMPVAQRENSRHPA